MSGESNATGNHPLGLLREITQAMAGLAPERALRFLLEATLRTTQSARGLLLVPDEKARRMVPLLAAPAAWAGPPADGAIVGAETWLLYSQGIARLFEPHEVVALGLAPVGTNPGPGLLVPLQFAGHNIGCLVLMRALPEQGFDPDTRLTVEIMAPLIASMVNDEQVHNEVLHKNARLSTLYEISRKTESMIDLRDTYDSMGAVVRSFIDCDILMIYLADPDGEWLETREAVPASPFPQRVRKGQSPIGLAASERKPQLTFTQDFKSVLILPLVVSEKLIGVVAIGTRKPYAYREEDIIGLRIITTQIASVDELFKDLLRLRGLTQHLLESLPAGVLTFDTANRVTLTNPAVKENLGVEVPVGSSPFDATSPFPDEFRQIVQQALESRKPDESSRRFELPSSTGPARVIESSVFPFRDETGRPLGVALFFRDVTQLHRMELQLRRADKLSALGVLASGVAHEIRNPLTGVKMIVQLLSGEFAPDDPKREPLKIIQDEIDRLEKLISNLLDFARSSTPQLVTVKPSELVDACLLLLQSQIAKLGLQLSREYHPDLPTVVGDPGQLKQVLLNILTNAIQASKPGGRLTVRLETLSEWLLVEIEDTGCGIPNQQLKNIFDPFVTTKDDGTGLGLSIALRIIEDHRGRIEVDSKEGIGSRFTIHLPLAAPAVAEVPGQPT